MDWKWKKFLRLSTIWKANTRGCAKQKKCATLMLDQISR